MTEKELYTCKYCKKSFRLEKTLMIHVCVKKQRFLEKDTIGSQLGLRVYQRFYELTTKPKNPKTLEEFINSKYYVDFIKFGRHLVALNPINANDFIDYIILSNVKLKDWCKDYVYYAYLKDLIQKERAERAVERTIIEMQKWAQENNDILQNFFLKVNTNEATFLIRSGKISPWVIYLSGTGMKLFERLNKEQADIISVVLNPKDWEIKFRLNTEDVRFVKEILEDAKI